MTKVITRLYSEEKRAHSVADKLRWEGIPQRAIRVVAANGDEDAEALKARLHKMDVHPDAVTAYVDHIGAGKAAVVVHATHKPLGAAKITRRTMDAGSPVDLGGVEQEQFVPDGPSHAPSILDTHPRFLTSRIDVVRIRTGQPVSNGIFPKTILKSGPRNSAIRGGRHMSRMFWPMPLLKKNRKASSAMRGGRYMSRAFWPMPLLSRKERSLSVIPGGALPLSRALGWPTVSNRD